MGDGAPHVPALPSIDVIEVQIDELQTMMDAEWATAASAVTDRLRRPRLPRDYPDRSAAEQRRKRWIDALDEVYVAFAGVARHENGQ